MKIRMKQDHPRSVLLKECRPGVDPFLLDDYVCIRIFSSDASWPGNTPPSLAVVNLESGKLIMQNPNTSVYPVTAEIVATLGRNKE